MKDHKELKRIYKETPLPAGIYQIRNVHNGKVFIGSAQNMPGILNRHQAELRMGVHRNVELLRDWQELGPEAFAFEVLDELEIRKEGVQNIPAELELLLKLWLERLQPYGERGYNKLAKA